LACDVYSRCALAEQIEDAALTMERRLQGRENSLEGTLRIASSDWFGAWMLPGVIDAFVSLHEQVTVELLTGSRIYSLSHREADLAFRVVPFEETDIVQRRLLRVRFGAYVRSDLDVSRHHDGLRLKLIEDAPTETHPHVDWPKQRLPKAKVVVRANNRTVRAQMCVQGVGVALLPRAIGDHLSGIRRIDLDEEPPHRNVWMGYHRDLRTLRRLRAFVDLAVAHISDGG
jgi:DNA-binding transcriptional LysR family regulator